MLWECAVFCDVSSLNVPRGMVGVTGQANGSGFGEQESRGLENKVTNVRALRLVKRKLNRNEIVVGEDSCVSRRVYDRSEDNMAFSDRISVSFASTSCWYVALNASFSSTKQANMEHVREMLGDEGDDWETFQGFHFDWNGIAGWRPLRNRTRRSCNSCSPNTFEKRSRYPASWLHACVTALDFQFRHPSDVLLCMSPKQ